MVSFAMLHVALLEEVPGVTPVWASPLLITERLLDVRELDAIFSSTAFDAVVFAGSVAWASAKCRAVEEALQRDVPALLIAAPKGELAKLGTGCSADGVLDAAWTADVAVAVIQLCVERVHAGRHLLEQQREVITAIGVDSVRLRDLSIRDALTGLYNLRHFRDTIAREHSRATRTGGTYAVAVFDMDNLREVNNRYGHGAGDRALVSFADVLIRSSRATDSVFRLGGDEFAVLLIDANEHAARAYAERARRELELTRPQEDVRLSASIGVASYPRDATDSRTLLERADGALYRAKALGRNRVVEWSQAGG